VLLPDKDGQKLLSGNARICLKSCPGVAELKCPSVF